MPALLFVLAFSSGAPLGSLAAGAVAYHLGVQAAFRLFGFEREYLWFPREGFFVRSPLKADGVTSPYPTRPGRRGATGTR